MEVKKVNGVSTDEYSTGKIVEGRQEDLSDVLYHITALVSNTGEVGGAEVAQLYVGIPGGRARQLGVFSKVDVEPRKSVEVSFDLKRRDLSVWDTVAQK